jgi:uncharacterized membrane protein
MEMRPPERRLKRGLLTLAIALLVVGAAMGVLLAILLNSIGQVKPFQRDLVATLAWVAMAMLALTLVLLVWVLMRYIILRTRPGERTHTDYVDAWSLAGERFRLDEKSPDEDEDRDDEEDDGEEDSDTPPGSQPRHPQ